jgi:uncharacterized protein CbrC (UPF0167 family)
MIKLLRFLRSAVCSHHWEAILVEELKYSSSGICYKWELRCIKCGAIKTL